MYYDATYFPQDVREKFAAHIRDNRILLSCTQAIYGMYDAGTIAGTVLSKTLTENGYLEVDATNLWTSTVKGEEDLLINTNVDDFAIIHVPASRALARLERVRMTLDINLYEPKVTRSSDSKIIISAVWTLNTTLRST